VIHGPGVLMVVLMVVVVVGGGVAMAASKQRGQGSIMGTGAAVGG